jgi:hypothetical protein
MNPYRSARAVAVPKTLEARLEIMKAISALTSQEAVQKFDPNQPRVAAANPDGGQWTGNSSTNGVALVTAARSRAI